MESKSNKQASVTSKITSVKYHDIFDYKLTKEDLVRWQYKNLKETTKGLKNKSRLQREKHSIKKLKIAKRAAKLISKISTIQFVGITGALAMMNAGKDSDIDLMIITKHNTLWTTRLRCYVVMWLYGFKTRKPRNKDQKDALCLNMWLDEDDLIWGKKDRNIYTAHEISQIVPLTNNNNIYEKFLYLNRWVLDYWPNAVKVIRYKDIKSMVNKQKSFIILLVCDLISILENLAFKLQYFYMRSKMTREQVTPTRAIFHPYDWGENILKKLSS